MKEVNIDTWGKDDWYIFPTFCYHKKTHTFVDLKVDEIETTIFENTHEINKVIENLQEQ